MYAGNNWSGLGNNKLKGVPVNMSSFVFAFCVFPSSCNACYTGLLSDILPVMLENAN